MRWRFHTLKASVSVIRRTKYTDKISKMNRLTSLLLSAILLLSLFQGSVAFSPNAQPVRSIGKSATSLNMVFGKKKTAAQKAEEEAKAAKYWQGEWVCKDCGYIYNRVRHC